MSDIYPKAGRATGFDGSSPCSNSRYGCILGALMLAVVANASYAGPVDLADLPVGGIQIVPPNFWITFDRSGSMGATYTYDNTVRYYPWLYDGTILPPKGPVRFPNATVAATCQGWPYVNGYTVGTPDTITLGCNGGTTNLSAYAIAGPAGYNAAPQRTDCAPTACSTTVERQNYANWYQYYRTRLLFARAGIGEAVGNLPYFARLGFVEFEGGTGSTLYEVDALDGSNPGTGTASKRYAFFKNELYPNRGPGGTTPTRQALIVLGEHLKQDAPYRDDPTNAGSTMRSCRKNINFLMTDGYWNSACHALFPTIGNADGVATSLSPKNFDGSAMPQGQISNASPFGDANGNSNANDLAWNCNGRGIEGNTTRDNGPTLADIAWYYWVNDLKTNLTNNVDSTYLDPVIHQHLVNYGVYIDSPLVTNTAAGTALPLSNIQNAIKTLSNINGLPLAPAVTPPPPAPAAIAWPNPLDAENVDRVYDLWHAGLNSRGGAIHARDAREIQSATDDAFADRSNAEAQAAATPSNPDLSAPGVHNVFFAGFDAHNWTGNLSAFPLDPATSLPITGSPVWANTADYQLDFSYHVNTGSQVPDHTNRKVVTHRGDTLSPGIPFRGSQSRGDGTTLATLFALDAGGTDGANVVDYIRGAAENEGVAAGKYRPRPTTHASLAVDQKPGLLGDIVDSTPEYIDVPNWNYSNATDPGWSSFKAAQASRSPMLAVGANDGMLHVFDASTGAEIWAYVPSFVFDCSLAGPSCAVPGWAPRANYMRDRARNLGFQHQYLVDGRMTHQDVDFSRTVGGTGSPDWHTLLIGGLGKGGHGIFALDVTTPPTSEVDAASKVVWEFPYYSVFTSGSKVPIPEAKNVGYSYAWPHVVKVNIGGVENWVVLLPSGYNNGTDTGGDGKGRLFVLNARTGQLIRELVTSAGTAATPSGLAQISAWVEDQNLNKVSDAVYGGDLLGNVWRFDLSDPVPANWTVTQIATLTDPSGSPQPITTAPELTRVGGQRWMFFGTGKYLGKTDRPGAQGATAAQAAQSTQIQSMWGFKDPGNVNLGNPVRNLFSQYTLSAAGTAGTVRTASKVSGGTLDGWVIDLSPAERINIDPLLGLNALAAGINSAPTDPCEKNGAAGFMLINVDSMSQSPSSVVAGFTVGNMTVGGIALTQTTGGGIRIVGTVSNKITNCPTGLDCFGNWVIKELVPDGAAGRIAKRVFWRELPAQ